MHDLLSDLDNVNVNESISFLAYIFQIRSNILLQHELETLCLELYKSLKKIESIKTVEVILLYFVNVEKQNFITLNNFTIYINDKWFYKMILLASLRHSKELCNKKDTTITIHQKHQVLQEAMLTFRADKIESILILRLIENLIKNNKDSIVSTLAVQLLLFSQKVAISSFECCKNYAHNISKIALLVLDSKDIKIFSDLSLLPIKGIKTVELVPYLKQASIDKKTVKNIVTKVIQMFLNNIENREGGFLFRSILFEDFSYWREVVWPQFFVKFQIIDFEGEFFQSLVKYWIPQCVYTYKAEFYTFIGTKPIPNYLKGHILLETKRKGLIKEFDPGMIQLLITLFENDTTTPLALKIVSSYSKGNLYPCNVELQLVNRYICGQTEALDIGELKCLHRFLSQIGVVGSDLYNMEVRSANQEKWFVCFKSYVLYLHAFCLKLLKTYHRDIGAQILMLFWKLINGEKPYLLNYRLDKEAVGFYNNIFQDKEVYYTELIEKALLESNGNFPELTKLCRLMVLPNKLYSDNFLLTIIDEATDLNSITAADSVKNMSSIIVSQNKPKENTSLLQNLFNAVTKHFQNFSRDLRSIFKGTLLFEAVLEVSKNVHSQESCRFVGFDTYCLPVVKDLLQDIVYEIYQKEIMNKGNLDCADQQYNSLSKIQKIVESLLNNVLQFIMQDCSIWSIVDKTNVMNLLVKIIETSNMRRPTTLSADVLRHVSKLVDEECRKDQTNTHLKIVKKNNEDASYKIKLLHNTLEKLFEVASVPNLTIRRNPESRLIIHAFCQSETHPQKPLLNATLLHLLKILSDPTSTDFTVSSAMHCTEILISDNSLYNCTLRFVPGVIMQCVEHFKNRNWVVRNANIQLARSLIDRFLGVLMGQNNRPKSVEDLFCLFPQLTTSFCQTLIQEPLTDSSVIVSQIFSESQTKKQPMKCEYRKTIRNVYSRLFIRIIKESRDHYGFFAVRSYTSLCLEESISDVMEDVIDFVIENFDYIKEKHTIRNFVLLLRELYDKYLHYIDDFPVKPHDYYVIHANLDRLSMFLKRLRTIQFDLLLLKVLSIDEVMTKFQTSNFDISDYRQRLWQHNYVPLLLINTEAVHLDNVLKEILFKNVLDCIQVKILSILVDRYSKNNFSNDVLEKILNVLIQKVLVTDDNHKYLHLCYFKVIFLFLKCNKTLEIGENCIKEMRFSYREVQSIQKMFVPLLVLTRVNSKNDCDKKFIRTTLQSFRNLDLRDFDVAEILSEMLASLYINIYCICNKYSIFKMALFLIVEHGLFSFVSFITKSKISSPLIAIIKILDLKLLSESFDSDEVAYKFVKEFYDYIVTKYAKKCKIENKTYYVEEKHIFVDRVFIDKIILKFLYDFNQKQGNLEWFQHYEFLQSRNKS